MPYIKSEDYGRASANPKVPGELNYAITLQAIGHFQGVFDLEQFNNAVQALVDEYMDRVGVSYTNYNAVIGVLFCCGFELIRRVTNSQYQWKAYEAQLILNRIGYRLYHDHTAPYEDEKIAENGDVFPVDLVREA